MVDANQIIDIIITGNLNKVLSAIVILLLAFMIARFFGNLTNRILKELNVGRILKEKLRIRMPIEQLANRIVYYLILLVGVILALNQIGISKIILYIILMIIILIAVSLILLAFKDFIPNAFASFWIHQKKLIEIGDEIEVKDISGKVIEITLTETKIETKDKEIVLIPNSLLLKEKIKKK